MAISYVDRAINRVIKAAHSANKSVLARRAGLTELTIRDLGAEGWAPRADTLKKLEQASLEIQREIAAKRAG